MGRLRLIGVLSVAVLAGCAPPSPSAPTSSLPPEPSVAASATSTASVEIPSPVASWLAGALDAKDTTPFGSYVSTGTSVIWSSGARAKDLATPDLYAFAPGGPVQLVYDNPNRDASLYPIAGRGGRFAFVESKPVGLIAGPWKLWYLAAPGAKPALVDVGSGHVPFIAISDRYLVWTIGQGEATSYLKALDLLTMKTRILEREPPGVAAYGYPALDGSRLVYDVYGDQSHVYYRDLSSEEPAVRIDASWCAGGAAIRGDDVVWAECAASGQEGGRLIHYSLATHALDPLSMPTIGDLGFINPSIGTRYVAAWAFTDRMLYLADLQTGNYPAVLDLGPTNDDAHAAVGQPNVSDDLLAYVYWSSPGVDELRWVVLR